MNASVFDVVIVAGGASRRMGTDKASLTIDGRSLLERAVSAAAAAHADRIIVVGGSAAVGRSGDQFEVLADSHPGSGPLGAVVDGLRLLSAGRAGSRDPANPANPANPARVVVVVAVDHPDLRAAELQTMAELLRSSRPGTLAIIPSVNGRSQPLHGAYALDALHPLGRAFAAGERSLLRALEALPVERPDRTHERDVLSYVDVDDPDQWATYLADRRPTQPGSGEPTR